ncbi:hypothetical protein PG994_007491 [Apiospora phragmitis]|uniref:DUF7721 domain-containing protein n=1 Tax=Apiospora phragmitis TaxID=2905665 RepID=A0ABR1V123_9PEZI
MSYSGGDNSSSGERRQDFGGNSTFRLRQNSPARVRTNAGEPNPFFRTVTHGGFYPAGGYGAEDDDFSGAAEHASRSAGASADPSLFTTLLGALTQKKQSLAGQEVDEDDAVKQHKKHYAGDDDGCEGNDQSLGAAAAMQALKMFSGGASGNSQQGNSQSAFIGTAMAEASKVCQPAPLSSIPFKSPPPSSIQSLVPLIGLVVYHRSREEKKQTDSLAFVITQLFDQKASQGKVSGDASKESTIMQAGELALKMYMKSKGGDAGGSSGGGLLSLASKFM